MLRNLLTLLLIITLPWQAMATVAPGWIMQTEAETITHCAQHGDLTEAEHPPAAPKPCPHCHAGICCSACQFPLIGIFAPPLPLPGFIPYPAPAQRGSWIIPDPPHRPPRR
jgi:hypothetical protein